MNDLAMNVSPSIGIAIIGSLLGSNAMEIDQDQAVMVSADKVVVSDFMGNIVPDPKIYTVDWDASAAEMPLSLFLKFVCSVSCADYASTIARMSLSDMINTSSLSIFSDFTP